MSSSDILSSIIIGLFIPPEVSDGRADSDREDDIDDLFRIVIA